MRRYLCMLLVAFPLLGCNQKYTILKGTTYPNPPQQRIKILVIDFKGLQEGDGSPSPQMARQAEQWFQRELASEYVDASTEGAQTPDAPTPTYERRLARNPFIAVDREPALQRIKAAGIDLRKPLEPSTLVAVGKLDVTDLVLLGSVGMAKLPRLDMATGATNTVVLGATATVTVARMGIMVADTRTGEILLDIRKQRRYRQGSDPVTAMAREAVGEILWTSFF